LAPHEEYILRHLKIVQSRISKLTDEEMAEQKTAAPDAEYDRFIASLPEPDDTDDLLDDTSTTSSSSGSPLATATASTAEDNPSPTS
jgi:hypothetical protein